MALAWLWSLAGGQATAEEAPGARTAVLVYRAPWPPRSGRGRAAARPVVVDEAREPRGARPAALDSLNLTEVARELRQALALRGLRTVPGAIDQALRARQALLLHGGQAPQAQLMALGGLREQLAAGRALLGQVELERAEATFAEAERRLWETPLPAEATLLLAETLRWRGVALLLLRREAAAEAAFRQALALQPDGALTEAEVRPDVVAAFRRVERALRAERPLRLLLTPKLRAEGGAAAPVPLALRPALVVTIDGVEVSLTEERAQRPLAPGAHVVTARLPGYQVAAQVARLTAPAEGEDDAREVTLELSPDPPQTALTALRGAPELRGLSALCAELGLQTVIIASPGGGVGALALVGQRYQCAEAAATPVMVANQAPAPPAPGVTEGAALLAALPALSTELLDRLFRAPTTRLSGTAAEPGESQPTSEERGRVATPAGQVEPEALVLLRHPALREPPAPPPPPPRRVPLYARPWPYLGGAALTAAVLLGVLLWPRSAPQTQVTLSPGSFP